MIHAVFNRPTGRLKVSAAGGGDHLACDASGSAWGDDGPTAPYGHDCQIAPGHYLLTRVEPITPPLASEGAGQIYVSDLDERSLEMLIAAGRAAKNADGTIDVGGIALQIGELATHNRSEVMLHGGGSNLGEPACFAPVQPLCRTEGCTRLHNRDLALLMPIIQHALETQQLVVYSVVGDSPALPE